MALEQQKIDQILALVRGRYPDWEGFSHPKFIEDEISYKQEASLMAQEYLSKDILNKYLDAENSEEFIKALERVARSTNLLFLGAPRTGDLSILYTEDLDNLYLCKVLFDLLCGDGNVEERLARYLDFINQNEISFKWTFPTYFLYLLYPETEIFIKPEITRWFLKFVESDIGYSNKMDINIYVMFRDFSSELRAGLEHLKPQSMMDIQSIIYISAKIATGQEGGVVSAQKRREFKRLFEEFILNYPNTQAGKNHIEFYSAGREEANKNHKLLLEKKQNGEDITDEVLLKYLPYTKSINNQARGAWVHIAPALAGDIKKKFENAGWQKAENWPEVSAQILSFVMRCINDLGDLDAACKEFSGSPVTTGFQTGMMTPILNALKPDEFILINNKSRALYNYFTNSNYSQKLLDYSELNEKAKQLLAEVGEDISGIKNLPALETYDLIDMFSHWLKAIKKFEFAGLEELAEPFSKMFSGRDDADWAFNWIAETCGVLGIQSPDNPMATFTLRYKEGHHHVRLSYGKWLTLGFSGRNDNLTEITLALFEGDYGIAPTYDGAFSQDESEQPVHLYSFSADQFFDHEIDLRQAFNETLEFILQRFENWKSSPYHHRSVDELAQAIFDLDIRDKVLQEGLRLDEIDSYDEQEGTIRYWKIAPGENAWQWDDCRDEGFIALGWDEIGDLSGLDREDFEAKRVECLEKQEDWTEVGLEQLWKFYNIEQGDIIVANQGTTRVLGIGSVSGEYYFVPDENHGHRFTVKWFDLQEKQVNEGGWRRTLVELDKTKYDKIKSTQISEIRGSYMGGHTEKYLSPDAFMLLEELHENPYKDFYMTNKSRFQRYLFEPFKSLYSQVSIQLPVLAKELLETEKRLFSQIFKNDYGKGGAYDYFWGAFYPKGTSRSGAPQLSIWINKNRLEFGFYIGVYGKEFRERFTRNCSENLERLKEILEDSLSDDRLIFGREDKNGLLSWEEFLQKPDAADFDVTLVIPRDEVLQFTNNEIVNLGLEIYSRVFPLVLLAYHDNPLPLINEYLELGTETEIELSQIYTIAECAQDTYMEEEQIGRWVSAIQRKGQSILYGPPGTGKTYLAEHLAKHLIGGGDGFIEVVQFHPSYAYEDFMQGIRPKTMEDGKSLSYPLVPGRFVEFCKEARLREGICVLIIDEINRANLSRVFGELMYLLEYRNREIPLSGGGVFRIPENVFLLGTMNTADRSIALVDHALRRRFAFLELGSNYEIIKKYYEDKPFDPKGLIEVLKDLNKLIGDKHYEVGISFFLIDQGRITDFIEDIWRMEIEPYLEEYFFDQPEKVNNYRWNKVESKILT